MAYAYVWEFTVRPECRAQFAEHYGPEGSWVRLFRQSPQFIETRLLADQANGARFLTIDRWHSAADYAQFRQQFAAEYAQLDAQFEQLTDTENLIGAFDEA